MTDIFTIGRKELIKCFKAQIRFALTGLLLYSNYRTDTLSAMLSKCECKSHTCTSWGLKLSSLSKCLSQ